MPPPLCSGKCLWNRAHFHKVHIILCVKFWHPPQIPSKMVEMEMTWSKTWSAFWAPVAVAVEEGRISVSNCHHEWRHFHLHIGGADMCRTFRLLHSSLNVLQMSFPILLSWMIASKMGKMEMTSSKTWSDLLSPFCGGSGRWQNFLFWSSSWVTSFSFARIPVHRKRKWRYPRWWPEAEVPPSFTATAMGTQKAALYYSRIPALPYMRKTGYIFNTTDLSRSMQIPKWAE